ncbi:MAG: HIT family hydrolase [Leptospira sp.]|nr:HIT family hydrolase [Leptospira sp.]
MINDCKICEIHKSAIPFLVYEDHDWIVRHSERAKNCPGYLYLEPKLHVTMYPDFPGTVMSGIGNALKAGTDWIYGRLKPEKIYTLTISEVVPHIHFHIVPRYSSEVKGLEYLALALNSKLAETELTKNFFQKVSGEFIS